MFPLKSGQLAFLFLIKYQKSKDILEKQNVYLKILFGVENNIKMRKNKIVI